MQKGFTKIDEIKFWIDINSGRIMVFSVLLLILFYGYFSHNNRKVNFQEYTTEVELINFNYEKSYSLPNFYSTEPKLDRIIFNLTYFHKRIKYESKAVVYSQYISPQFEKIIENKEFDNLIVRCKKETPKEVMIFIKTDEY